MVFAMKTEVVGRGINLITEKQILSVVGLGSED
jgi:hypothetical protein